MSQIEITCIDQTAIFTDTPEIFSGDVNVDSVKFTFDNSWNDYTSKTAVFYNDPKKVYPQILNENNIASIPKEVIANKCKLSIGVVGTNANGDIKTSKILTYNIGKGAISDDLESSTATPDIWLQILTQIEYLRTFVDERQELMEAQITQKQNDFETLMTQEQNDFEAQINDALVNHSVYVYALNDTSVDDYLGASTLPYDFYHGDAIVLNNEIHILGGDGGTYKEHYKWNGTSWTSVSTLPYNFRNGDAIVLNDEIHILGSINGSSVYKNHYKWNGTSWSSVLTLPYDFYHGDAIVLNNEIHLLGTYDSSNRTKHYKFGHFNFLSGYVKANVNIYLPIPTKAYTDNLEVINDGYRVTQDGYVKILIE